MPIQVPSMYFKFQNMGKVCVEHVGFRMQAQRASGQHNEIFQPNCEFKSMAKTTLPFFCRLIQYTLVCHFEIAIIHVKCVHCLNSNQFDKCFFIFYIEYFPKASPTVFYVQFTGMKIDILHQNDTRFHAFLSWLILLALYVDGNVCV